MTAAPVPAFSAPGLHALLARLDAAGLPPPRVLGQPVFTHVAPCLNNFMVAQRFEDALEGGAALDDTIDYVPTLRMRPVKVKLRLLAEPGSPTRYVLVQRKP